MMICPRDLRLGLAPEYIRDEARRLDDFAEFDTCLDKSSRFMERDSTDYFWDV